MTYPTELTSHLITKDLVKRAIIEPETDSHKGQNGTLLVIGGSPLFHGAGRLTAAGAQEAMQALNQVVDFGSKYSDYVIFCSTQENIDFLKGRQDAFIGVKRESLNDYLPKADAVVIGTGMMREVEPGDEATMYEPKVTRDFTMQIITSQKKAVLDAGSIQVITPNELKQNPHLIITPHRTEMANLFGVNAEELFVSQEASPEEIQKVGTAVHEVAKEHHVTILLKGPIDIIASDRQWYFSPGGDPAMTKGGTGDVLAGVTGALYTKLDDPLLAAAAGSYITKRAGEYLRDTSGQFFNATDLAHNGVAAAIQALCSASSNTSTPNN
ncbi:hypothetical protein BH11PAT1_BH11PAT1_4710 [soil metagenome]